MDSTLIPLAGISVGIIVPLAVFYWQYHEVKNKNETITEGMIPKINTCLDSINNGVTAVGIIDGRKQHSILFEIFSDKGSGTLIRK